MELRFETSGSGNLPLVCVHGWGCEGGQFTGLGRFFEKDFQIFRLDLPGHGRTPLDSFSPGFETYAAALADFVRQHRLERPVLLGHSMGGVLSLIAAGTGRLQPRAIINLDGSFPPSEKTLAGQRTIRGWLDLPDFRQRLAGLLREAFFAPSERDARCDGIIQTMCAAPEAVLRFLPEQVEELHAERILPPITAPVLFIGAGTPRFDGEKAAAAIPNFRLEHIPHAGHFLHLYAADRVAALIKDFLRPEILR